MTREVWFQLVDGEGTAVTSANRVKEFPDEAIVADLRDAVFAIVYRALPATRIASDLTVFENQTAFDAKQALEEDSSIGSFGGSKNAALIVQVPPPVESAPRYFILPETREKVTEAVFVIVEEETQVGVGMGVFFSPTLAVTCDHNLTEQHPVGSLVQLALEDEVAIVEVVARNSELDFAILKASEPRSFIAPWSGSPDDLESRFDLVLASFRLGIDRGKLGFAPAACIAISRHRRHIMFSCPTYAGDSGAALLMRDGCLVGIHQETINALREEMERKKVIKDRLTDVEESMDNIARSGCLGLLVHAFRNVASE